MKIYKENVGRDPWLFVHLNKTEALALAESLLRQVRTGDPNTGRPETPIRSGTFSGHRFTMMVDED
jgi:hypothetical protein